MRRNPHHVAVPVLVLALVLLLLAPLAPAMGTSTVPSHDVTRVPVGNATFAGWITLPGNDTAVGNVTKGANATFHMAWSVNGSGTYRANVSMTSAGNLQVLGNRTEATGNFTASTPGSDARFEVPVQAGSLAGQPGGVAAYITLYRWTPGNGTNGSHGRWSAVAQGTLTHSVRVRSPPSPPGPALPWTLVGAAAVVVVVAGGAGYAFYRRRQRPRVQPRSRTLQELEAERSRKPREQQRARQEVAAREDERRQTRELRILQAKVDDLERSIELARQRLEAGELTAYQFERIRERKERELASVRQELDELEEG